MSFHFSTGVCPTKADELHAVYIDAYLAAENFHQLERELDDHLREFDALVPLIDNVNDAIENLCLYGKDAIPTLNIDKGLESLMKVPEQLITVEKALEALDEQKKNLFQKFIDFVKELFTKIHIWVKNFINKIRTSDPLLSNPLSEKLKKQGGHDNELRSATSEVVGSQFLSNLIQAMNKSKNCRSFVTKVIESKTIEDLEKVAGAIFFSACSGAEVVNGRLFDIEVPDKEGVDKYTTPTNYSTSNKSEYHPWMNEADGKAGITMSDLVSIERAQKDMLKTMVEFDGEVEVRLKSLVARLEKLDKADEEYKLLRSVVLVLASAVKSNIIFTGAINSSLDTVFKQIETKMSGGSDNETSAVLKGNQSSQPNRPAPVDTSSKINARVAIIKQIDKDEKNPKNQWAYKLALEADKTFKSKGVNDFFEEDDGLVYNTVIEIKAALQTNFSAVKIKRAMGLIENGASGSGNIGLRIKAKVEEFIKNNDKEGLKSFIINDLLSSPETYRFALKAADLAQKSFSDGFYREPEVAISSSDSVDTLKKKLKTFFTRGILSRIIYLSRSGTK